MRTPGTGLAALALAAGVLTGCASGSSAYCDELESNAEFFQGLDSGDVDPSEFGQVFDRFGELAEQAPEEVAGDWEVLDSALQRFEDGLDEAGLDPADLEGLGSGQLPEGVDPQALQELATTAQELDTEEFSEAGDNIEAHAEEECGVDLGGSGS